MKLTVNLEKDSYPIYIENNILSQAGTISVRCITANAL